MNPKRRRIGLRKAKQCLDEWPQDALHSEEWYQKTVRLWASSRPNCSCPLCGNPRRYFGEKTMQELRADISEKEQLLALND